MTWSALKAIIAVLCLIAVLLLFFISYALLTVADWTLRGGEMFCMMIGSGVDRLFNYFFKGFWEC